MSNDNRISAELASAAKTEILTKIEEIKTLLPFLINLTPEERKHISTIGTERTGMVAAFVPQMVAHPKFLSNWVEMGNVIQDRDLREGVLEVFNATSVLLQSQSDTLQLIGSDLYLAFMDFYANAQRAAKRNVAGAETVLNDLKRFVPRGRTTAVPKP